jgi:hypothetical protein
VSSITEERDENLFRIPTWHDYLSPSGGFLISGGFCRAATRRMLDRGPAESHEPECVRSVGIVTLENIAVTCNFCQYRSDICFAPGFSSKQKTTTPQPLENTKD